MKIRARDRRVTVLPVHVPRQPQCVQVGGVAKATRKNSMSREEVKGTVAAAVVSNIGNIVTKSRWGEEVGCVMGKARRMSNCLF